MDAIVGQFLDYARLSIPGQNEMVNMSLLLEKVAVEAARSPDVLVQSSVEQDLFVRGNAIDFERMFSNLVSNAERYGRAENSDLVELGILCRQKNEEVVIEISDQGPGISEEDRERLLRPFIRLNNARSQANGSGLGLAIVNRIVQRHGGRLVLKNNMASGLVVSVAFPLAGRDKS